MTDITMSMRMYPSLKDDIAELAEYCEMTQSRLVRKILEMTIPVLIRKDTRNMREITDCLSAAWK